KMGNLRKYMPVTFVTMMIGTLAIAGIPPLSGFFSKDEILLRAFLANKVVWTLAVITALMTAFYMYRLMSMTFFGAYRGPAWGHSHGAHLQVAAAHGVVPPADVGAHGHGQQDDHEVSHGPADTGLGHQTAGVASAASHGHGEWHGPHESPRAMTAPLMALAVGAIVAGFVGVPAVLKGNNAIESFLEPSFTAHAAAAHGGEHAAAATPANEETAAAAEQGGAEAHRISAGAEL